MKIQEGETYQFQVIKYSMPEFPGYVVLMDPYNQRHLLDTQYYPHLGISELEEISCKVDKINCSGKVYLEPIDPYYKEGHWYTFPLVSEIKGIDFFGNQIEEYCVRDIYGREIKIPSEHCIVEQPGLIKANPSKIKKGKLKFGSPPQPNQGIGVDVGKEYLFTVEDETTLGDREEYFVLKDPYNHQHYLIKKYFGYLNLRLGSQLLCYVDKWSTKGFFYLEPRHPHYEIGRVYSFDISGFESGLDGKPIIFVKDVYNQRIRVELTDRVDPYISSKTADFKVIGLRRGIPILAEVSL